MLLLVIFIFFNEKIPEVSAAVPRSAVLSADAALEVLRPREGRKEGEGERVFFFFRFFE